MHVYVCTYEHMYVLPNSGPRTPFCRCFRASIFEVHKSEAVCRARASTQKTPAKRQGDKFSKNWRISACLADCSKISVVPGFCDVVCALTNTLSTARISSASKIGVRKQRPNGTRGPDFGTSDDTPPRAQYIYHVCTRSLCLRLA